jgi:hydrogenase expression/formation protein HypC
LEGDDPAGRIEPLAHGRAPRPNLRGAMDAPLRGHTFIGPFWQLIAKMCLAIPGKVIEIRGGAAKVDFGGIVREIDASLVSPKVGDYVIVHAGFAIQILDEEEAKKTLEIWSEIFELGAR